MERGGVCHSPLKPLESGIYCAILVLVMVPETCFLGSGNQNIQGRYVKGKKKHYCLMDNIPNHLIKASFQNQRVLLIMKQAP